MTASALGEDLASWIKTVTGATHITCEQHPASGRSRMIWLVHAAIDDQVTPMLLRSETGRGPFAGTEFTLAREARLLTALTLTDVPVPGVHGVTPDGTTVLMDLVPGEVEIDFASQSGREALAEYCRILARLHQVDTNNVRLPQPALDTDHALLDLQAHQRSYRSLCPRHETVDEVLVWLIANAPRYATRTSVIHGDAGPGNFLHRGGHVTGLIDWEMAHVGDPMDDLAWLWFRVAVLPTGPSDADMLLTHMYRSYSSASGSRLDRDLINYYCMAVLARCLIATLVRQSNSPDCGTEAVDRMTGLVRLALDNQRNTGQLGSQGRLAPLPPAAFADHG